MGFYSESSEITDLKICHYIEERKRLYEDAYGIKVLFWTVRKSILRGMCRKQSDLDIVFVFVNNSHCERKIIFERADRRNEFQCWSIDELLLTVEKNKILSQNKKNFEPHFISNQFKHYFLDYYNACYCYFGSPLRKDYFGFMMRSASFFEELYSPLVPVNLFLSDLEGVRNQIKNGETLSLNQYLYAVWCSLACRHLLDGGLPGNVDLINLGNVYLRGEQLALLKRCVVYFRNTAQKQSNFCRIEIFNHLLLKNYDLVQIGCQSYQETVTDVFSSIQSIKKLAEEAVDLKK